ncbi:hypothetical protein Scep_026007 [Stephania cephalantha]|uniref:Uncharacterized protein n=1 Tax=Stephania cephalantha TaxID=152367 RepID=A0AAP0ERJ6_9MAGN
MDGATSVPNSRLVEEQENRKRKFLEEDYAIKLQGLSSPCPASFDGEADSNLISMPSSTKYLKKGHSSFFGQTPRGTAGILEAEANGPTYSQICLPIHENLLNAGVELSSNRGNVVDDILHELLQSGGAAQKYMQGSRSMKIDNWILLDNVVQGRGARTNASKNLSKRSKRHMSLKQHRKYGSFDFPIEFLKFEMFMPMHNMWKDYIMQLIKNIGKNQLAQSLLSADFHGAILLVADSKIISLVGVSGIMVRETAETFGLVTPDNKFRVVPKRPSVFIFRANCWKITLYGDQLISRSFAT